MNEYGKDILNPFFRNAELKKRCTATEQPFKLTGQSLGTLCACAPNRTLHAAYQNLIIQY
jgi:hypothetical protein